MAAKSGLLCPLYFHIKKLPFFEMATILLLRQETGRAEHSQNYYLLRQEDHQARFSPGTIQTGIQFLAFSRISWVT
jgi:hypothetical protein